MNPVVHFEMPAEDTNRMKDFYSKTFGWNFNQLGPEMGNYVVVDTSDSDKKGPRQKGMINGGFYPRTQPDQAPSVVIAVEDIRAHMKKVEEAGGKVQGGMKPGEPDNIPGVGLFIAFIDTEGNRVGMLQPTGEMAIPPQA